MDRMKQQKKSSTGQTSKKCSPKNENFLGRSRATTRWRKRSIDKGNAIHNKLFIHGRLSIKFLNVEGGD